MDGVGLTREILNRGAGTPEMKCDAMLERIRQKGLGAVDRLSLKLNPGQFDSYFGEAPFDYIHSGWAMIANTKNSNDRRLMSKVFGRHIEDIGNMIGEADDNKDQKPDMKKTEHTRTAVNGLLGFYRVGDDELKRKVNAEMDRKQDTVGSVEIMGNTIYGRVWEYKLDRAVNDPNYAPKFKSQVQEYLSANGSTDVVTNLVNMMFPESRYFSDADEVTEKKVTLLAEAVGVPMPQGADMVRSWLTVDIGQMMARDTRELDENVKQNLYVETFRKHVSANIKNILMMKEKTGSDEAVIGLYQEFGITHFGRYPADVLIDQWKNRDDKSMEYGLWIGPYSDWNTAFDDNQQVFSDFVSTAGKNNARVRVVEARGRLSVAKRIKEMNGRYGDEQKISFIVLSGHGEPGSVQLGEYIPNNNDFQIRSEDLSGKGATKMKNFYVDGMPMVFISCSTGVSGGVAQQYSVYTGGETYGPEIPTNISKIHLVRDEKGKLTFENVKFKIGAPGRYDAGSNVREEEDKRNKQRHKEILESLEVDDKYKSLMWEAKGRILLEQVLTDKIIPAVEDDIRKRYLGKEIGMKVGYVVIDEKFAGEVHGLDEVHYRSPARYVDGPDKVTIRNFSGVTPESTFSSIAEDLISPCLRAKRDFDHNDGKSGLPIMKIYLKNGSEWIYDGGYLVDLRVLYPQIK
jgi:hypothetical protein